MFRKAFQSKVDKKREANVQGISIARKLMPLCVLLPHMRQAHGKAYVQKMAPLNTPNIPQSPECGYQQTTLGFQIQGGRRFLILENFSQRPDLPFINI